MEQVNTGVQVSELDNLVEEYRALDDCIDEADQELKKMRAEKEKLGGKLMGILKTLGRKSYACEAGTFTRVETMQVKTPKTEEEKAALFEWLTKQDKFLQYASVHHQSLNSLWNEEYEAIKESGDPEAIMDFKIPGVKPPTLFKRVSFKRKKKEMV